MLILSVIILNKWIIETNGDYILKISLKIWKYVIIYNDMYIKINIQVLKIIIEYRNLRTNHERRELKYHLKRQQSIMKYILINSIHYRLTHCTCNKSNILKASK
jgi:hypothetical protein